MSSLSSVVLAVTAGWLALGAGAVPMPGAPGGPPLATCADTAPVARLVGGASNFSNFNSMATESISGQYAARIMGVGVSGVNPCTVSGMAVPGVCNNMTSGVNFQTPGVTLAGSDVSVVAWIRMSSSLTSLTTLLRLGNNTYLHGHIYGFCVSNRLLASTSNGCAAAAPGSFVMPVGLPTNYPTYLPPATSSTSPTSITLPYDFSNQWVHIVFVATQMNQFSLYVNGALAGQSIPSFVSTSNVYPNFPVNIGMNMTSIPGNGFFVLGDLQVYNFDVTQGSGGANAMAVYGGYSCGAAMPVTALYSYSGANSLQNAHKWISAYSSAPLNTTTPAPTSATLDKSGSWNPCAPSPSSPCVAGTFTVGTAGMGVHLGWNSYIDVGPQEVGAATGVTFIAHVYRTWVAVANIQQSYSLFHAVGAPTQSAIQANITIAITKNCWSGSYSTATHPAGFGIAVTVPSCGTVCYFSSALAPSTLGVPGSGFHVVVVRASLDSAVRVTVDGVEFQALQMISLTAPPAAVSPASAAMGIVDPACSVANVLWPKSFPTTNTFIGGKASTPVTTTIESASAYGLMNVHFLASTAISDAAVVSMTANAVYPVSVSPPPPPPWAGVLDTMAQYAACASLTHRYGNSVPYPFINGIAIDGAGTASGTPWNAPMVNVRDVTDFFTKTNLPVRFPADANSRCPYFDFGSRVFPTTDGSGFSIAFMLDSALTGTLTNCANAPGPGPIFDIGGYSAFYKTITSPAYLYLTSPDGAISAVQSTETNGQPLLPIVPFKYTVFTYGVDGLRIYVDGNAWGFFPSITFPAPPATSFNAFNVKFWGIMYNSVTILDLQIYSTALTPLQVRRMAGGRDCGDAPQPVAQA